MKIIHKEKNFNNVLLIGQGRHIASIGACLALSGSEVTILSNNPEQDYIRTQNHINDDQRNSGKAVTGAVRFAEKLENGLSPSLVIITGIWKLEVIQTTIRNLENLDIKDLVIAVATDHLLLSDLQKNSIHPENIMVVNWTEPAHTTFFLEIVQNKVTNPNLASIMKDAAKNQWRKDPYVIQADLGVRGRMQTAMLREAMYLVQEGYANVEDIDRACRNDAGTYLPFAGHFQYMDLMGTYAYGVVMEKLNKELSNSTEAPAFFDRVIEEGREGMTGGKGFYKYTEEEVKEWETKAREFSFEIRELIEKDPFSS